MKQAYYARNNNLHESDYNDLSSCRNRNMQVSIPIKLFFMKKIKILMVLGLILLSSSLFAVSIQVGGIVSPNEAANGIYHLQADTKNGKSYWVHESGNYNIHYALWFDGTTNYYPYWYIDNDYEDQLGLFYGDPETSPLDVTVWTVDQATGPVSVTAYSTVPEINIMGNGTTVASGDNTPSFSDYTKFAATNVSGVISTRTYTINNTGTVDALTIGAITIGGPDASDFTVTTAPTSTVNQSGSTTLTITFNPSSSGEKTATVSIVNNDSDENPYGFAISGYGYTPKNLVVSGITSPSAVNGTYTHQGVINDYQYWKNSTADYYIYYSPTFIAWVIDNDLTTGGFYFSSNSVLYSPTGLTYANSSGTGSVSISEEVAAPEINIKVGAFTVSDGSVATQYYKNTHFGSLEVASGERAKSYTIENTGNATLTLSGASPYFTITGTNASDFSVTATPSNSITASGTTTLGITFNPSAIGTRTATVTLLSNDEDEAEYTFAIQGEGVNPRSLEVSNITAPSAANGTYVYQGILNEFQYWKHSSENYYIFNSRFNGIDPVWYIDVDLSADLNTTSSYNFYSHTDYVSPVSVTSWTSSSGNSGTPNIVYTEPEMNVTGNSANIISGDATPSIYDHTDFGYTDIAAGTIVRTFTIQNTGTETLTLSGSPYIAVGGADAAYFVVSGPASGSITAGASTTFTVTFDPNALREFNATLSIANNDGDENPYNFSIKGTGSASPTITTQAVSSISTTTATGNVNITDLGSSNPTAYGVCWNTTGTPTTSDNYVDKGAASATGAYTASLTGLTASTTYYVRAYATNTVGTSYGAEVTFKTKTTPVITWNNPLEITYGTLLSATELNATANVAGTYTYTPAIGTKLNAGKAQVLQVDFTPTDATNYEASSKTVTIDVAKATPVITWSNPTAITYGTLLSATQLNATADVAGSMVYTPAIATKLNAGDAQDLKADFTPTDAANYNTASKTVTIDVDKATPVIAWSNPADINNETALSSIQLNAIADVAGIFTYTPAIGIKLNVGDAQALKADFEPTDAVNYESASKTVYINVFLATGISEVGTNKLVIFPNPVIDFFSVSGIEGRAKISLSDLNGRVILTKEISNNEMISLSTFLSGIYVVTLEDINGFTSRTILKK
jgi:hypothetical protein